MKKYEPSPGQSQQFVLPAGFVLHHDRLLLQDENGIPRVFYELSADPDHPQTDFAAAWNALLGGMPPGAVFRVLQYHLPNKGPRSAFIEQIHSSWVDLETEEGDDLKWVLVEYLQRAPVPLFGRTILELETPTDEALQWVMSIPLALHPFQIFARLLSPHEVQAFARWFFNPEVK